MSIKKKSSFPINWEYIFPTLAIVSLIISCVIISLKKKFWNDELYSYYFLADQSFTHMLVAFSDKINNTPPLYFIIGWLWAKVFGATELSLRLFSSLGICIACTTVWITLRRTYNLWSASIGTLAVFCTSSLVLSQNAEARMYGLFMALCSLALLQFDINNKNDKCSKNIIIANSCIHAAIVLTHLHGFFYSGAIVFSQIVRDRYFKVFKPKIYLSIVLSWLSLILYIPAFLIQADAGNPRTWLPTPSFKNLSDFLLNLTELSFLNLVVLLLVFISGLQFLLYKTDSQDYPQQNSQNWQAEISLLIFAYTFLAVPIFVWIISRTVKPIFWDRYMISSAIGWSIVLGYVSERIILSPVFNTKIYRNNIVSRFLEITQKNIFLFIIITILLVHPISYAKSYARQNIPGLHDGKYGYKELPIVVDTSHRFFERFYYSPERNKYFFILDWQAAVDKASGLFGPQEYKHLDAWKRNYSTLFQNHISESEDFLNKHHKFLFLFNLDYDKKCPLKVVGLENTKYIQCPRWFSMRILNNPDYKVTRLGVIEGDEKLLLVEKK